MARREAYTRLEEQGSVDSSGEPLLDREGGTQSPHQVEAVGVALEAEAAADGLPDETTPVQPVSPYRTNDGSLADHLPSAMSVKSGAARSSISGRSGRSMLGKTISKRGISFIEDPCVSSSSDEEQGDTFGSPAERLTRRRLRPVSGVRFDSRLFERNPDPERKEPPLPGGAASPERGAGRGATWTRRAPNRTASTDMLSGAFGASFAKVLRPVTALHESLQIMCMAVAEEGSLIITGGTLTRHSRAGANFMSGFINVWQRSSAPGDYGQWKCASLETDNEMPPVTCLCLCGSLLVTGHHGTEESMKAQLRQQSGNKFGQITSFNQNTMPIGSVGSDVCVWDILADGEGMALRIRESNRKNCVTALAILEPLEPGAPLKLASVAAGSISIWTGLETEHDELDRHLTIRAHKDKVRTSAALPVPPPPPSPALEIFPGHFINRRRGSSMLWGLGSLEAAERAILAC